MNVVYLLNIAKINRAERTLNVLNMIISRVEDESSILNFFLYKMHNLHCHLISLKVYFLHL